MAFRRTRIKGIANIPQRKKPGTEAGFSSILSKDDTPTNDISDDLQEKSLNELHSVREKTDTDVTLKSEVNGIELENGVEHPLVSEVSKDLGICFNGENNGTPVIKHELNPVVSNFPNGKVLPVMRRKLIKPAVSAKVFRKKHNLDIEEIKPPDLDMKNIKIVVLDDVVLNPFHSAHIGTNAKPLVVSSPTASNEITLSDTTLLQQHDLKSEPEPPEKLSNISMSNSITINSDAEYPPPPTSPSKMNRSRIKAIPRFSNRKMSFSASESEDENKRINNRNRNDSVCSSISGVPDSNFLIDAASPRPKEFNSVIQRKCRRTDQSRKLAEARREFYHKFGSDIPDRKKLTMIDLIFYNPTTNPLIEPNKPDELQPEDVNSEKLKTDSANEPHATISRSEEVADDPVCVSDEENEIPAPQIKIGPNGEIILDEKSLVIENKNTKRNREEMERSKLVDGNTNGTYGIYKKVKRSKDWSQMETLRFYKALNTLGTDFSLMCELFPNRTRRELKMKFKKEEKVNRVLIDRAIMEPCNFDFAELQKEVVLEERQMAELEAQRKINDSSKKTFAFRRRKIVALTKQVSETPDGSKMLKEIDQFATKTKATKSKEKVTKPRTKKLKVLDISDVLNESDADASEENSDSEIAPMLKQTRCGRIPKLKKIYDPNPIPAIAAETVPIKEKIQQPGSIILVSTTGPDGKPVYQVFMVAPPANGAAAATDCEGTSLNAGVGNHQSIAQIESANCDPQMECNVVIPAEENNVTVPVEESSN